VKRTSSLSKRIRLKLLSAALYLVVVPNCLGETSLDATLRRLVGSGAKVSYSVRDQSGREIAAHNPQLMKPASVLKTLTSAAAVRTLGVGYKFKTEIYAKGRRDGEVQELVVKGYGDPSLTIEDLFLIARRIRALGIKRIGKLSFDDTAFIGARSSSGARSFEAGSSALSLNFNSLTVTICPGDKGERGEVQIDPWEADVTVVNQTTTGGQNRGLDAGWSDGKLRVSGEIGVGQPCEDLYRSVPDPVGYFAGTLGGLLEEVGVKAPEKFEVRRVFPGAVLIYTHESKPLGQILQDLNWYSNNFIAQQLVFALGRSQNGSFSEEAGLSVLRRFADPGQEGAYVILDGSGLSHGNRVTSALISHVLYQGSKDGVSGPEYLSSFSRPEVGGTLKRRSFGGASSYLRGKTGSLDGVSSLAGVVGNSRGTPLFFALLQNEIGGRGAAQELEEQFVKALYQYSLEQ